MKTYYDKMTSYIKPTIVCVKVSNIRKNKKDTHVNLKTWMADENNVYIGRKGIVFVPNDTGEKERWPKINSKWCNPYNLKEYSRDECIDKYRTYIERKIKNNEITIDELKDLSGKTLGCWCKPEACHGDVIVEMFEKYLY